MSYCLGAAGSQGIMWYALKHADIRPKINRSWRKCNVLYEEGGRSSPWQRVKSFFQEAGGITRTPLHSVAHSESTQDPF